MNLNTSRQNKKEGYKFKLTHAPKKKTGDQAEEDRLWQPEMTGEPTVDTTRFVAVVKTVIDLVTLLGAVDAGTITALELIRTTRQ